MSIRLDFSSGTVKEDLSLLIEKMREAGLTEIESVIEGGEFMAKGFCPVDTGSLQASIRKEKTSRGSRLRAGGYVTNPKTGKVVNYAVYVELKTPFMGPAFDWIKAVVAERVKKAIVAKVNVH